MYIVCACVCACAYSNLVIISILPHAAAVLLCIAFAALPRRCCAAMPPFGGSQTHTHTHTHTHTRTPTHKRTCTHAHTNTHTHVPTDLHSQTHTHTHTPVFNLRRPRRHRPLAQRLLPLLHCIASNWRHGGSTLFQKCPRRFAIFEIGACEGVVVVVVV